MEIKSYGIWDMGSGYLNNQLISVNQNWNSSFSSSYGWIIWFLSYIIWLLVKIIYSYNFPDPPPCHKCHNQIMFGIMSK